MSHTKKLKFAQEICQLKRRQVKLQLKLNSLNRQVLKYNLSEIEIDALDLKLKKRHHNHAHKRRAKHVEVMARKLPLDRKRAKLARERVECEESVMKIHEQIAKVEQEAQLHQMPVVRRSGLSGLVHLVPTPESDVVRQESTA
jgi:hypothetical protein